MVTGKIVLGGEWKLFHLDKYKQAQIDQILHLVKIASISIPAIAYMQYYFNISGSYVVLSNSALLVAVFAVILLIYLLWTLIQARLSNHSGLKVWIDPIISMSIALLSVMMTGRYASGYKYLFLFVIIYSSIECSKRASITVAGVSAAIVLGVDLLFAPAALVNTYFESDLLLVSVFLFISWTIGYYVNLEKEHIERLSDLANIDGLTGLYNHRYFHDTLSEKALESKFSGNALSLLFIDIDNFKYYNDIYGHQKGDEILKIISGILKDNVDANETIARYGGEEFAAILPGAGASQALKKAEKLRKAIQQYPFDGQEALPSGNLTISVGVSTMPSKAKTEDELIKGADDACYRAKFLSKNRVEMYSSILEELQNDVDEPDREIVASIKTLIAVINAKDKYTYRHVERVVYYCNLFADKLGLGEKEKKDLVYAAYLHDIGKINIPEEILIKVDALTRDEWEMLKKHPQNAVDIISNIHSLQDCIPIILQHHEMYNGGGYPNRLKAEEIHYLARILTVVDSFDAMTSFRPYQPKKTYEQAIDELNRCSGTQFDPEVTRVFIELIKEKCSTCLFL